VKLLAKTLDAWPQQQVTPIAVNNKSTTSAFDYVRDFGWRALDSCLRIFNYSAAISNRQLQEQWQKAQHFAGAVGRALQASQVDGDYFRLKHEILCLRSALGWSGHISCLGRIPSPYVTLVEAIVPYQAMKSIYCLSFVTQQAAMSFIWARGEFFRTPDPIPDPETIIKQRQLCQRELMAWDAAVESFLKVASACLSSTFTPYQDNGPSKLVYQIMDLITTIEGVMENMEKWRYAAVQRRPAAGKTMQTLFEVVELVVMEITKQYATTKRDEFLYSVKMRAETLVAQLSNQPLDAKTDLWLEPSESFCPGDEWYAASIDDGVVAWKPCVFQTDDEEAASKSAGAVNVHFLNRHKLTLAHMLDIDHLVTQLTQLLPPSIDSGVFAKLQDAWLARECAMAQALQAGAGDIAALYVELNALTPSTLSGLSQHFESMLQVTAEVLERPLEESMQPGNIGSAYHVLKQQFNFENEVLSSVCVEVGKQRSAVARQAEKELAQVEQEVDSLTSSLKEGIKEMLEERSRWRDVWLTQQKQCLIKNRKNVEAKLEQQLALEVVFH
jgi:hypothetical protein